jgi:uncharacterized damage-inducible protein DinB
MMDLLDRLLEHDRWTTSQILAICRTLPSEQLHAEFDVGNHTLGATLRHMIANIQVWTALMHSRPVDPDALVDTIAIDELAVLFPTLYLEFALTARRLRDDGRLDDVYLDTLDNPPQPKSFGGTIAHVITHNMHHRAELLHMLGLLGVPNLPEGDVLSWEAQARSAKDI